MNDFMARPITWREWDATRDAQSLLGVRFAITPLGRRLLRQAEERCTAEAQARSEPQGSAACIWCRKPICAGQAVTIVGGEPMHDAPCRREFESTVYGDTDPAEGR